MNTDHKVETISSLLPHFHTVKDKEINSQNIELDLLKACYDFAYTQGLSNFMVTCFTKFYHKLMQDTIMKGNMYDILFELF